MSPPCLDSYTGSLQWRHNGRGGVSNHQAHDYLPNRLFGRRTKKTSKPRVTGLCEGNPPVTGGFPSQSASNADNISIWWRHHGDRAGSIPFRLTIHASDDTEQLEAKSHIHLRDWPTTTRLGLCSSLTHWCQQQRVHTLLISWNMQTVLLWFVMPWLHLSNSVLTISSNNRNPHAVTFHYTTQGVPAELARWRSQPRSN